MWEPVVDVATEDRDSRTRTWPLPSQHDVALPRAEQGEGVGHVAQEVLPTSGPGQAARRKPAAPSRRIPFVLGIIGALLLIVAVITAVMWYSQGRERSRLFNEYINGAQVNYQAGIATTDENQARVYLRAATEQLNQAALFFPDHPDVTQLQTQILQAEAVVNHVQPLLTGFDVPLIAFDGSTRSPSRVFVNGLNVYVLDGEQGTLERYQLDQDTGDRLAADAAPQVLVRTGDSVGGRRVGELADAVWAPAAGNRTATGPLVLDRSNQLFSSIEGLGAVNVTLGNPESLGFVDNMQYYLGNLYLLDKTNSQLWRYRPNGDDYALEPEGYFTADTSVNLNPVIDVAIDGSVWLLYPNGTVLRYFSGAQEAFSLDVVDPPLGDAVSIWANEAEEAGGQIFVGDAASNRILVFSKQGKLLSQLMPADHPEALKELRSLYVDEATNYLYLLTDTALFQVPVPTIGAETG